MLEHGGQIDVLYTDLEKAFDRIPLARLISKLDKCNISPEIIEWMNAFFNDGRQYVGLHDVFSSWVSVFSGVPQCFVLGPLLFVIYINDLPNACNSGSCVFLYADHAKIYRHILCDQNRLDLQGDINNSTQWANQWLIKLNIKKCKIVSYGRIIKTNFQYLTKDGLLTVYKAMVRSHLKYAGSV